MCLEHMSHLTFFDCYAGITGKAPQRAAAQGDAELPCVLYAVSSVSRVISHLSSSNALDSLRALEIRVAPVRSWPSDPLKKRTLSTEPWRERRAYRPRNWMRPGRALGGEPGYTATQPDGLPSKWPARRPGRRRPFRSSGGGPHDSLRSRGPG